MIGASAYVAAQYACLWKQHWRERTPLLFALVCILGAFVLICAVGIHASSTIATCERFLELRALAGLVFSIAQLWLYADLTANKPRWFLCPMTVLLTVILLFCLLERPLHGQVIGVVPRVLPWGETLWFPIRGPARWWGWPLYLAAFGVPVFATLAGFGLWRRDRAAGALLAVNGGVGFLIYLSAAVVDMLRLPVPYPAVFTVWLYMVLAVMLVTREYRQRSARVAASESRQAAVFNASNDGIIVLDQQGQVVTANPAALRLAGCGQNRCDRDCAARPQCQLMQSLQRLTLDQVATGVSSMRCEVALTQCGGTVIPVEAIVQTLADNQQIAWLATLRDLRERLRQERERRQLDQLSSLGLLTGGIAHDFRNIIAGVRGISDLMRTITHERDIHAYADMLAQCGAQANALCDDLLRFARREVGKAEVYDVHEAVRTTVKLFLSSTGGVRVNVNGLVAERTWVTGFKAQLQNAILNLCFNARDAMPTGGTITIASTVEYVQTDQYSLLSPYRIEPGQHFKLTVSDTGEGMRPEVLQQCFEPLFTTKANKGTGLGLSCVRSAIIEHRGAVLVSSAPGHGTTFTLLLPLWAEVNNTAELAAVAAVL